MGLSSYSELSASIADYLVRDDLSTVIEDFILLCEMRIRWGSDDPELPSPRLRARQMETRASLSIDAEYSGLPTDFLEPIGFKLNSDPIRKIPFVSRNQFDIEITNTAVGVPRMVTIIGSELRIGPAPDATYTGELWYYKDIAALSDANTTNWLLTASPNVYLYGSLLEAQPYLKQPEDMPVYLRGFTSALRGFAMASDASRWGGPLEMRSTGWTP